MVRRTVNFFGMQKIYIICDVCNERLFYDEDERVYVYHCWDCPDFDICNKCKNTSHPHKTYRIDVKADLVLQRKNMAEMLRSCLLHHDHLPALGYRQVLKYSYRLGESFYQLGILPGDRVILCAPNSVEWVIADIACILRGYIVVPVHFTLDTASLEFILSDTHASGVITTKQYLSKFTSYKGENKFVTVLINKLSNNTSKLPTITVKRKNEAEPYTLTEVLRMAKKSKDKTFPLAHQCDSGDVFTISYTSGSTGKPKGVIHSHKAYFTEFARGAPQVSFVYCPLAHAERSACHAMLINGGRIATFEGDMSLMLEHVRAIQPSHFSGPPRVWNKIFNDFNAALSLSGATEENYAEVEEKLLREFALIFGNRITSVSTGSAPTSDAVLDFMRKCYKRVLNGYGTKEVGEISINNIVSATAHVKLEDFDEFKKTDKPYARGEICVRTDSMASGYYNNPQETEEHFKDGWFHTGDVGQMMESGYLVIIGRKKQLFKLSQGEFVSPERLENIFQKCTFVSQLLIHGDSLDSFVVAIVVPDEFQILNLAKQKGLENETYQELCQNQQIIDTIRQDMRDIAKQMELRSFELPRGLHITPLPFTEENNQLTYSQKINRTAIKQYYHEILQNLIETTRRAVESGSSDNSSTTGGSAMVGSLNVKSQTHAKLSFLMKKVLGVENDDLDVFATGCDSLSATQFVCQIRDNFKVDLPIKALYTSKNIMDIVKLIDSSTKMGIPPSEVHSSDDMNDWETRGTCYESDRNIIYLTLCKSVLPSHITGAHFPPAASSKEYAEAPKNGTILLTGATGFLGSHLAYELLAQTNSVIYCMVRKTDSEEKAKEKVKDSMLFYELWSNTYDTRIVGVLGDISLPRFGWSEEVYEKMATTVDVIYHNGATVNSILPYSLIRAHNVLATQELLAFASSTKLKPVHYISSVSVFAGMKTSQTYSESDIPTRTPSDGYALSKYYAETLCKQATRRGIPVVVYRPGSISGSTRTGASNAPAFLNRLICGISLMGEYPVDSAEEIAIELVPVDFVSSVIVSLSMQAEAFIKQTFHIVNTKRVPVARIASFIGSFYGHKLKAIPFPVWKTKIQKEVKQSPTLHLAHTWPNPLFPVLATHFSGSSFVVHHTFSNHHVASCLPEHRLNQDISQDLVHLYLQFYVKHHVIPSNK